MKIFNSLLFCAALVTATPSFAAQMLYNISGGTFSDGTTFGGSFNFDADAKTFGDFSVTTLNGTLTGLTYTIANSGAYFGGGVGSNNFILFLNDGSRYMNFSFANPLSTGVQNFNTTSSYECNNCTPYRLITGGSVSTAAIVAAVPEPATWAMMLVGFGFIGCAMRSTKRRVKMSYTAA